MGGGVDGSGIIEMTGYLTIEVETPVETEGYVGALESVMGIGWEDTTWGATFTSSVIFTTCFLPRLKKNQYPSPANATSRRKSNSILSQDGHFSEAGLCSESETPFSLIVLSFFSIPLPRLSTPAVLFLLLFLLFPSSLTSQYPNLFSPLFLQSMTSLSEDFFLSNELTLDLLLAALSPTGASIEATISSPGAPMAPGGFSFSSKDSYCWTSSLMDFSLSSCPLF